MRMKFKKLKRGKLVVRIMAQPGTQQLYTTQNSPVNLGNSKRIICTERQYALQCLSEVL